MGPSLWNGQAGPRYPWPNDLGGRASLAVGWAAMVLALVIGTAVGVLVGLFQTLDGILMRFTDLVLSLPILPLSAGRVYPVPPTSARGFGPEAACSC